MAWADAHGNGFRGVYRGPNGAKLKTRTFKSRKKALQAALDEEARLRGGTWFDPGAGRITFADYFEGQWYPNRAGEVRTRDEYWSVYSANLKAEFGRMELRNILPSTVQGWINRQVAVGVGPSTVHARFKVLQTCLAARKGVSARRDRLIQFNPCEGAQLPVIPTREVTILELDQVERLIRALDPWWRTMPLLAAETGLRWGELMGLTVDDFTLDFGALFTRRTIVETSVSQTGNGTRFLRKPYPKTGKVRRVSLPRKVSTAVQGLIAQRRLAVGDRIFSMPDKTPPDEWQPPLSLVDSSAHRRMAGGIAYRRDVPPRGHLEPGAAGGRSSEQDLQGPPREPRVGASGGGTRPTDGHESSRTYPIRHDGEVHQRPGRCRRTRS